jgi:NhaP-type Na+/H+ or K+/H+ antiporter
MKDTSNWNFGVIIAFLLPGFLFIWGISYSFSDVALWLAKAGVKDSPTVGGFLYVTLSSLSIGLLISAVRWLIIDHIHQWTGIKQPPMQFANLKDKDVFAAFQGVVENHYRYYQYYANTFIAIVFAFLIYVFCSESKPSFLIWAVMILIMLALFCGSRDSLGKYYDRASKILSSEGGSHND